MVKCRVSNFPRAAVASRRPVVLPRPFGQPLHQHKLKEEDEGIDELRGDDINSHFTLS